MFYRNEKFVSPAPIYARIKEEMKTYFNTGQIDDLMFPIWTKDCIRKFKNTYYKIEPAVIDIFDGKGDLPCDFVAVREVYICATYQKGPIKSPFTFYYQTDCRVGGDMNVSGCTDCNKPQCTDPADSPLPVLVNTPDQFRITHKVTNQLLFSYSLLGLLKPGNHKTVRVCCDNCPNLTANSADTFDIINDKIVTSFPVGTVYMSYYADTTMENGYDEIPDKEEFQKYVYEYIRYMIYRQLYEQAADETINALGQKMKMAEQAQNDRYINARNEAMGETIWDKQAAIKRSYNRFNRFRIR